MNGCGEIYCGCGNYRALEKLMKFEEILPLMRAGKKARRSDWINKKFFIEIKEKFPEMLFIADSSGATAYICPYDTLKDDWELYEETKD